MSVIHALAAEGMDHEQRQELRQALVRVVPREVERAAASRAVAAVFGGF